MVTVIKMAGKFTNYTLQKNVACYEKLRNLTHLSFQNRKRKEFQPKPLLFFIKSEKPNITLSYLEKHYKFQSKPKIQFTPLQNRNAPHAYHRSVHISQQEQDESMFSVLTVVMFFVLSCGKDTFSVHDIPLI